MFNNENIMLDHIDVIGHGPIKVLMLHGWFGSAKGWGPLRNCFDTNDFTYAFFDYRGYGKRRSVDGVFSLNELSGDAIAVANILGWNKFSVVGHSMGGLVAQHLLAHNLNRVEALIGITPVPACGVTLDHETRSLFESTADNPFSRYTIVDYGTGQRLSPFWINKIVEHSVSNSQPTAVSSYFRAWADSDISDSVKGIPTPMLVLFGAHDPALQETVQRPVWDALYSDVTFVTIPSAGHYPMEETPALVASLCEKFLRAIK